MVSFRCPAGLLKDLDHYVAELQREQPGGNWSRSSAALNLVAHGLRAAREDQEK